MHGHSYVIKVELKSDTLNDVGFIKDYRELEPIKEWINDFMDHKVLNKVFYFNPTAELMCKRLWEIFHELVPEITAVEIKETEKTNARYEPTID